MKNKFKKIMIFVLLITILSVFVINAIKASPGPHNLTTYTKRSSGYAYQAGGKMVWKIGIKDSATPFAKTFYCLQPTLGLGNADATIGYSRIYDKSYNMSDKASIPSTYFNNSVLPTSATEYNRIMWVLDNIYIPSHTNATEKKAMRDSLILAANKYAETFEGDLDPNLTAITDDDIDVVQQIVLWQITSSSTDYKFANFPTIGISNNFVNHTDIFAALDQYNGDPYEETHPDSRLYTMKVLYNYLLNESALKAATYTTATITSPTFQTGTQTMENIASKYVIGPFKVNNMDSTKQYTATVLDQNNVAISGYTLYNSSKVALPSTTKIEDIMGTNFYIGLPTTTTSTKIKLGVEMKYAETEKTLWVVSSSPLTEQPVVEVEKTVKSVKIETSYDIVVPKYELNLTKVDKDNTATKLNGAVFKVTLPNGTSQNLTTVNGIFGITNMSSPAAGTYEYIFEEVTAPTGYVKDATKIKVNVTFDTTGKITNVVITAGTGIASMTNTNVSVNLVIQNTIKPTDYFDLALRKFITKINETAPSESREPVFNNFVYEHTKDPILVKTGDKVEYTIRVYNEGTIDGYAEIVKDTLPSGLKYLPDEQLNIDYGWTVNEDESVQTDYLSRAKDTNNLLKAFDKNTMTEPDYKEVKVICEVIETNPTREPTDDPIVTLRNIAEIEEDADKDGNEVTDIDSIPGNGGYIVDPTNPYNPNPPGNEDDIDVENLEIISTFDLALRKFITGVNADGNITDRIPVFAIENGKYVYNHKKTPVLVKTGDIVVYTIRIYNEGEMSGYAEEVKDNVPTGLKFLPNEQLNIDYKWKLNADGTIRTDYLSKASNTENIILPFNQKTMTEPDYKDIKVAFEVTEPNTSDRILINTAEISKDADKNGNEVTDIDSTPDNNIEKEDDLDKEYIKVQYFDLSLRKWVTKAIINENGNITEKYSGHTAEMNPEPIFKIDLEQKKLKNIDVKFVYSIRVKNEGEIAGYALEVADYIPQGLVFKQEDNPLWTLKDANTAITKQLENTLLQPGETATVEIILTWTNDANNMGVKTNIAEINEDGDENKKPVTDIDSTPGNKLEEDDIDDAPVMITIKTGQSVMYITLPTICLMMLATGIYVINKKVLQI